jgi:hypothetical protein
VLDTVWLSARTGVISRIARRRMISPLFMI